MNHERSLHEIIVEFLLSADGDNVSRHLDEITSNENYFIQNYEYYILEFCNLISSLRLRGDRRTVAWVFPLPASDTLITSKPDAEKLSTDTRASSIYLITGSDIFIQAAEEYRHSMSFGSLREEYFSIFRSWRDGHGAQLGWEFNNAIYLWSCVATQPPRSIA